MKKLIGYFLNIIFFTVIILVVIAISTIALTKKVNEYRDQYKNGISGTVEKNSIPVMSFTKGVISTINIKTGDEILEGDILIELNNPSLENEIEALKKFPKNESAQTQLGLYEQELENLIISAPIDGIVGEVLLTEGAPVDEFVKLLTIYSNDDIKLIAELTIEEYQAVKRATKIFAFSKRLNQSFEIIPDILNPDTKTPLKFEEKKIGQFFKFANEADAVSLLNNEDLTIQLESPEVKQTNKPVDFIVDFWNKILPSD